jgi:uncharacterized C2H2 Zn-finger protein
MNSAEYCKICGMAFIDKTRVNQHIDIAHKSSLFQCQSCNMVLTDEKDFNNHIQIHFGFQKNDKSGDAT